MKGFTLIELLVVVLIIGILAAIAVPQYRLAVAKSRVGSYLPLLRSLQKATQQYYMANGVVATDFRDLDIECPAYGVNAHEGWCYLDKKGTARGQISERSMTFQDNRVGPLLVFENATDKALCYGYNEFDQRVCQSLTGDRNPGNNIIGAKTYRF